MVCYFQIKHIFSPYIQVVSGLHLILFFFLGLRGARVMVKGDTARRRSITVHGARYLRMVDFNLQPRQIRMHFCPDPTHVKLEIEQSHPHLNFENFIGEYNRFFSSGPKGMHEFRRTENTPRDSQVFLRECNL